MQFAASVPFHGDTDKALRLAESALTAIGFRITARTTESVDLVGPGMSSTRQGDLVGASRIHLLSSRGELAVEADLGGVVGMSRFVKVFPIALVLFLGIVLSVVFSSLFGLGTWIVAVGAVVGGNAALWLLLGRLMARGFRARTCRGLASR